MPVVINYKLDFPPKATLHWKSWENCDVTRKSRPHSSCVANEQGFGSIVAICTVYSRSPVQLDHTVSKQQKNLPSHDPCGNAGQRHIG